MQIQFKPAAQTLSGPKHNLHVFTGTKDRNSPFTDFPLIKLPPETDFLAPGHSRL